MNIQFFDCPNCGKSLRVGARECHHCHAVDENDWADPDQHAEFASGGYDEDDDGEQADGQPSRSGWRTFLVIVIVSLLIISFAIQAISPQISF